jgi:hypothetical protein
MTTFFIGDELECYSTYTIGVTESTSGAISGFSRGSVEIPSNDVDYVEAPLTDSVTGNVTATNDVLWLHYRRYTGDAYGSRRASIVFYDSDGVEKVRRFAEAQWSDKIQIWNGTAWVDTVTGLGSPFQEWQVIDMRIKIGVEGLIESFQEGVLVNRWTGDTTSIGNISKVRFYGRGGATRMNQLILADYSTINHTIRRRNPTANGTNTGWVGDFSQVDDAPASTIGTDVIYTSQSGTKSTFTGAALPATTAGHVIKAVAVAEFSKNDGTGQFPQNVRPVLRVAGTDYEGPVNAPIGPGWKGGVAFWENNPATGAAWANIGDVNATEFGVVSKD